MVVRSYQSGFSLIETMIAVLMLGVGMVAIAGIFPMAGTIQHRTYEDMVTKQVGDTITALMNARGVAVADTATTNTATTLLEGRVIPLSPSAMDAYEDGTNAILPWSWKDRAYPSGMSNDPEFKNRPYYWVPMVRKPAVVSASPLDWQVFVFVVKKEAGVDYGDHGGSVGLADAIEETAPGILDDLDALGDLIDTLDDELKILPEIANPDDPSEVPIVRKLDLNFIPGLNIYKITSPLGATNASDHFKIGDIVLTGDGQVRTVLSVDDTQDGLQLSGGENDQLSEVWYAERKNGKSPTKKIMIFGSGVVLR